MLYNTREIKILKEYSLTYLENWTPSEKLRKIVENHLEHKTENAMHLKFFTNVPEKSMKIKISKIESSSQILHVSISILFDNGSKH